MTGCERYVFNCHVDAEKETSKQITPQTKRGQSATVTNSLRSIETITAYNHTADHPPSPPPQPPPRQHLCTHPVLHSLPIEANRSRHMCICKQRPPSGKASPASGNGSSSGSNRRGSSSGSNRRSNLVNKGMPPPPVVFKSAATQEKDIVLPSKPHIRHRHHHHHHQPSPTMTSLSLRQISHVLDPFFDTCLAVRGRRHATSRNAIATFAAAKHEPSTQQQRSVESAFLSASGVAQAEDSVAAPNAVAGSLRDFLAPGNSAWMDMIQEMEMEKTDMLR